MKIATRIMPSTTTKIKPFTLKKLVNRLARKKGKILNRNMAKAIAKTNATAISLGSIFSSSSSKLTFAEKYSALTPRYKVSNNATIPLMNGVFRTLYVSDRDFISSVFVSISPFGCLTQITMWFLERIMTPSITACPPNASEGSSLSLAVGSIPSEEKPILINILHASFKTSRRANNRIHSRHNI